MKSNEFANYYVVFEVVHAALNCWDAYRYIEWCGKALSKKIRRGITPDPARLENSSTVKMIAREGARLARERGANVPARLAGATGLEIRRRIASEILEYANAAA